MTRRAAAAAAAVAVACACLSAWAGVAEGALARSGGGAAGAGPLSPPAAAVQGAAGWEEASSSPLGGRFTSLVEVEGAGVRRTAPPRRIQGKIRLNGESYRTNCDCEDPDASSQCHAPVRLRVHQEDFNSNLGLDKDDIHALLGKPQSMVMMRAYRTSFADIDSRETHVSLCTPGGDFGEFLSALAVYESMLGAGTELEEAQVGEILGEWLSDLSAPMYLATDEDAVDHLEKNLHVGGETGVVVGLKIGDPEDHLEEELLKDLVKPANQGSYYLKGVLAEPHKFYVRAELVHHAVRGVYRALWNKQARGSDGVLLSSKVNLQVLQGKPEPRAWLNFRGNHACEEEHKFPGFAGRTHRGFQSMQVYVSHPAAATQLRRTLAKFFTGIDPPVKATAAEFAARLNRAGRWNTELTAEALGHEIPFYTIIAE